MGLKVVRHVWLVLSISLSEDKVLLSRGPSHDIDAQRFGLAALRLGGASPRCTSAGRRFA